VIGPIPVVGGKRKLAARIVALIPEHVTYVEPFAGGAQVFFCKPKSKVEVLNDKDNELVNVFRVMQKHPQELLRCFKFVLAHSVSATLPQIGR
jgi:DNA adenine methylase